jgi:hypothetical protein
MITTDISFIEQALVGTGNGNSAFSASSVVLGGGGNQAGVSGDNTIFFSTILSGGGNTATGGILCGCLCSTT